MYIRIHRPPMGCRESFFVCGPRGQRNPLQDGPDSKRSLPPNSRRTRTDTWIRAIEISRGIELRTMATLTIKWIAGQARISAHSDHQQSKDLRARPDHILRDRRATRPEAVERHACLTAFYIGSSLPSERICGLLGRGVRREGVKIVLKHDVAPRVRFGERDIARALVRPATAGSAGTLAHVVTAHRCIEGYQSPSGSQ